MGFTLIRLLYALNTQFKSIHKIVLQQAHVPSSYLRQIRTFPYFSILIFKYYVSRSFGKVPITSAIYIPYGAFSHYINLLEVICAGDVIDRGDIIDSENDPILQTKITYNYVFGI